MKPIPTTIPALVTGASSGIGEEFARRLAGRGHDLVVVARREDRLRELAADLQAQHGIGVDVLAADLETEAGRTIVAERLRSRAPWLLVNNAGFGSRGPLATANPATESAMVRLNVLAVEELTLATLPGNVAARAGGVLNVASTAAFQPIPYFATYAAGKAFVLSFTEALAVELRGSGVRACVLCPGPTSTEFFDRARMTRERVAERAFMSVDRCVAAGLRALDRGEVICVPGLVNTAGALAVRVVPRALVRNSLALIQQRLRLVDTGRGRGEQPAPPTTSPRRRRSQAKD